MFTMLSMLLIPLVLVPYGIRSVMVFDSSTIQIAWETIDSVYKTWKEQNKIGPNLLLLFYNDHVQRYHRYPVLWNNELFTSRLHFVVSPYEDLRNGINQLLVGYPRHIDPKDCKLFYHHGGEIISINSDEHIKNMLMFPPDFEAQYRQVFVVCDGIDQCNTDKCKVEEISPAISTDDKNIQYQLALDAFRHVKAHQFSPDPNRIEAIEEELGDMGLADFSLNSDTIQVVQQDSQAYHGHITEIGKAFHWSNKIISSAMAAPSAEILFESDKSIEFDSKSWKIEGHFTRFASFLNGKGDKISYTVASAHFAYTIPNKEKEQSFMEKYITGSGTIQKKYAKKIMYLMESDLQAATKYELFEPVAHFFKP